MLDFLIELIDPRLTLVGGCRCTLAKPAQRARVRTRWSSSRRRRSRCERRAGRRAVAAGVFAAARDIGQILARSPGCARTSRAPRPTRRSWSSCMHPQAAARAHAGASGRGDRQRRRADERGFTEHSASSPSRRWRRCARISAARRVHRRTGGGTARRRSTPYRQAPSRSANPRGADAGSPPRRPRPSPRRTAGRSQRAEECEGRRPSSPAALVVASLWSRQTFAALEKQSSCGDILAPRSDELRRRGGR